MAGVSFSFRKDHLDLVDCIEIRVSCSGITSSCGNILFLNYLSNLTS